MLKVLALVLTAALPLTITADVLGVALPAVADTGFVFSSFIAVLTLLTASTDYRRIDRQASATEALLQRSALRLAA